MTVFPTMTEERRRQLLEPQPHPMRVLIDTDAANEIDDQYALTWAVLSPEHIDIEAIVAAPYSFAHHRQPLLDAIAALEKDPDADVPLIYRRWSENLTAAGVAAESIEFEGPDEGMERSFDEIVTVYDKLGLSTEGLAYRGSPAFMAAPDVPIESEGATRIVEAAMASDDRVLVVAAIGAVTNIASALLIEPEIASRMVVTWTSGYPTWTDLSNAPSLNLVEDVHASRLLFESGVPLVYLPGFHIGAQLLLSLPEVEQWIKGRGAIGDYLHHLYTHNPIHTQRAIAEFPGQSWVCWDLINFAWIIEPDWVPTRVTETPTLDDDLVWSARPGAPNMLEATDIDRDAIFGDFIAKLHDRERILARYGSGDST